MKALFFIIFLMLPAVCFGAPFLACNPSTESITLVEVEITKGSTVQVVRGGYVIDGPDAKVLNIEGLTEPGAYRFRVRWARSDGWYSAWSPFHDAPGPATGPGNVRVVP